ncbi:MAG: methylmalonyl-CoA mutase family protein, partial [Bacteroidia bacterium]
RRIDAMGGSVSAIEQGYMQDEIAASSYAYQRAIERNEKIIVGVNKFNVEEKPMDNLFTVDDSIRAMQMEKIRQVKAERDQTQVTQALQAIDAAARSEENLMPRILTAVEAYATLGEIADVMRNVYGEYKGN